MRRRVLIALLAFGTLAGYSSGFASLYRWHRYGSPYGGHCHSGRGYNYNYNYNTDRWAPPPAQAPRSNDTPAGPQVQAQEPATNAPAEPGPR